jgi:hypothetical protein
MTPSVMQALRQPACSIRAWNQGNMTMEPTPTPA